MKFFSAACVALFAVAAAVPHGHVDKKQEKNASSTSAKGALSTGSVLKNSTGSTLNHNMANHTMSAKSSQGTGGMKMKHAKKSPKKAAKSKCDKKKTTSTKVLQGKQNASKTASAKQPLSTGTGSSFGNSTLFGNTTMPFVNATRAGNSTASFGNSTVSTGKNSTSKVSSLLHPANVASATAGVPPISALLSSSWSSYTPTVSSLPLPVVSSVAPPIVSSVVPQVISSFAPVPRSSVAPLPSTTSGTSPAAPTSTGSRVKFGGVNMSGFDFGCDITGTCNINGNVDIVTNGNAVAQMAHFVKTDGLNAFRLPVGWQYLVNNNLGGTLDATNAGKYDALVQGCLASGATMCIIDVHNYARYNGGIIGQGGPTNDQYASLWSQIATKYASEPKVAFDIMNEPHDIPDLTLWAASAQAAVTAIREAGATSQVILLPGTDFASAGAFVSSGSAAALSVVQNPNGGTDNLIYNVHMYLDSDGSGTHSACVTNNIPSFTSLATYLRQNGRAAMLTETGGGPTDATCLTMLCQQMDFINQNSDVYMGITTWAAGGFDASTYALAATPFLSGSTFTDQELVSQCVVNKIGGGSGLTPYLGAMN